MGIGKAGAKNAALLAAQILALHDETLKQHLLRQRQEKRAALKKANDDLQGKLK